MENVLIPPFLCVTAAAAKEGFLEFWLAAKQAVSRFQMQKRQRKSSVY